MDGDTQVPSHSSISAAIRRMLSSDIPYKPTESQKPSDSYVSTASPQYERISQKIPKSTLTALGLDELDLTDTPRVACPSPIENVRLSESRKSAASIKETHHESTGASASPYGSALLAMKANLEDQVTMLQAKISRITSRLETTTSQKATLVQTVKGLSLQIARKLGHDETVMSLVLEYLKPVKTVDGDLEELYSLIYYKGDQMNEVITVIPPAPPVPHVIPETRDVDRHSYDQSLPSRMKGVKNFQAVERLHVEIEFIGVSKSDISLNDAETICDRVAYSICQVVKVAAARVWAGAVKTDYPAPIGIRSVGDTLLTVQAGIAESDDPSALGAIAAIRKLTCNVEALTPFLNFIKCREVKINPVGLAKAFGLGRQSSGMMISAFPTESLGFAVKLGALNPLPPASGWGSDSWEIRITVADITVASHLSSDGKFDEVLLVNGGLPKGKMTLSNIWLTNEGKAVNREILAEKEVEFKTGVVDFGNSKLNINVLSTLHVE